MKSKNLRRILGIGVCMCMFMAGLVGCSENKTQKESSQTAAQTESKKENKTLIMASGAELNTLYPLNMDVQNNLAVKQVYEGLVNYEDGKVVPSLAESWKFNGDGTKLTFSLRKGVKFHDGTPFNAEVVKANYDFARKNPNFGNIKALANAQSIDVINDNTLTFTYSEPYFAYLTDFCYPEVMVIVSPKVIEKENYQNMKGVVGTGPYVYKEFKNGEYTKLVKNEDYWGQKPYYDEIIIKYIPESSSRLQALKKGEIDMIYGNALLSWDDYKQATELKNVKGIVSECDSKTNNLVLNASSQNLSDKKVREAIAYAIDKKAISEGLAYGNETVAEGLFPKGTPYTDFEMNVTRKFSKEKANTLLEEAGWKLNSSTNIREKDGKSLTLSFTYNSGEVYNKSIATVLKSQLSEVGVDIKTEGKDIMSWWKEGAAGKYDITIWNTEQPHTIPHGFFTPMVNRSPHAPSIANLEGKDKFIEAIEKFQIIDDEKEVKDIFKYLINYSNDNVIDIPLTYGKDMIVYNSDKIGGYDFTSTPMFFDARQLKAK
jgi:peptide/nickel transport system substrate-binding protein/nickel transport system substrate-binding protein